jgi:hypothetical protein
MLARMTHVRGRAWSLVVLAGCAHPGVPASGVPPTARVEALSLGLSEGTEGPRESQACGDFSLTEAQVRAFFSGARTVTPREIHDDDDLGFAPCLVTGTLSWDGQRAAFDINPFLVATLRFQDGATRLLACDGACARAVLGGDPD